MKTLLNITLALCLLGSVALADGEMPGGGRSCPPEGCPPPPCTVLCGGASAIILDDDTTDTTDVIFTAVESVVEDALLFAY